MKAGNLKMERFSDLPEKPEVKTVPFYVPGILTLPEDVFSKRAPLNDESVAVDKRVRGVNRQDFHDLVRRIHPVVGQIGVDLDAVAGV